MSLLKKSARPWRLLRSSTLCPLVGRIVVLMILSLEVFLWHANLCHLVGFRNREQELDTTLKNTKEQVRNLEVNLR
jgi:hypothetical protein